MADELTFESLDAIEKHFGKLKKAAGDDAEAVKALGLEEREAKADFRDKAAAKRELDAHRKELLTGSDLPDEAKELVQGGSIEELDASFAKIKAMAEKLRAASSDDAAAKLYGNDAIRPGGGTPPGARTPENEKWIADFQERFTNGQVSKQEIDRYVQILGGTHLLMGLAKNSQHFERRGVGEKQVTEALSK
jgi:hypothetical protein